MSKRDEFIALMQTIKKASPNIPNDHHKGYIKLGMDEYGLTRDEAEEILKSHGPKVGAAVNYFEVIGLTIDQQQDLSDADIKKRVQDAFDELYNKVRRETGNPRTQKKLNLLNEARDILKEKETREQHIKDVLEREDPTPESELIEQR